MSKYPLKVNSQVWAVLALAVVVAVATGCSARPATLEDPTSPRTGYQRHIMVVLEREDFRPVSGVGIKVEVASPTTLVSPAKGYGRTNSKGGLELILEPLPHYDEAVVLGGDVVVDYPVKIKLTVSRSGKKPLVFYFEDRETYARYADPLYHGLNRDPKIGITYYNIVMP